MEYFSISRPFDDDIVLVLEDDTMYRNQGERYRQGKCHE